METIPCPGCSTDLEPSATVCPICLRPRGKLEITRAYATLREMKKRRQERPFVLAGYLLAAGTAGWLLYRFHAPLIAAAVSSRARLGRMVDEALYPPVPAVAQAVAPPRPAEPAPPPAPPAFAASAPPPAAAPAEPAPAPAASVPVKHGRPAHVQDLPLPEFDSGSQWAFYGRVFDLITLLPVADVQLRFAAVGNSDSPNRPGAYAGSPVGPPSDAEGRFVAVLGRLPDGGSYEIRASRSGYASTLLYESDIPYASLSLAQRREIARNAQDGDMPLPPLSDVSGEQAVRRDVFVAPGR